MSALRDLDELYNNLAKYETCSGSLGFNVV